MVDIRNCGERCVYVQKSLIGGCSLGAAASNLIGRPPLKVYSHWLQSFRVRKYGYSVIRKREREKERKRSCEVHPCELRILPILPAQVCTFVRCLLSCLDERVRVEDDRQAKI